MTHSVTDVFTPNASKYLQQLCKHFGHKVDVQFTPEKGHIEFPFGECHLTATEDKLSIKNASTDANTAKMEKIIADHLARFAFRENPTLVWHRSV